VVVSAVRIGEVRDLLISTGGIPFSSSVGSSTVHDVTLVVLAFGGPLWLSRSAEHRRSLGGFIAAAI
jgi:hypothetical protein